MSTALRDQDVRCLKLADWPEPDRQAWAAAARGDADLLADPGLFAGLRPASLAMNESAYGRWLWFLLTRGRLRAGTDPGERITPAAVRDYLEDFRAHGNAPVTVAHRVLRLERAALALAPERDWRWLRALVNRLFLRAKPVRDQRARLRPASEVAAAGHAMMADAEAGEGFTSGKKRALAFRDGLLLALLAVRGLRAANFGALELGRQLRRTGEGWQILLEGWETKNGEPYEAHLPDELRALLERYLARWRPVLLGDPGAIAPTRLWISAYGRPLAPDKMHFLVTRATEKRLGVRINPHLLRSALTTELAIEDPEHAGLATPLLGHRGGSTTTTRHYNLARQHEAARRWQEHVAALRRKARRRRSGG